MGAYSGPNIINEGLTFYYDLFESTKSWRGEPTTNLAANNFFSGNGNFTINETIQDTLPNGSLGDVRYLNADYVTNLNRTVSIGGYSLQAGETYTLSFYVKNIDCTGFNGNLYSPGLGRVIGGISYPQTFTDRWVRVKSTFTVPDEGVNPVSVAPQAFRDGGYGKFKLCWLQLEQKNYATHFTQPERTNTNSILDLTNNHILTATSLTYQENDIPVFDGVNNYISTNIDTLTTSATYIVWLNRFQSVGAYNMFMGSYLPYFAFRSGNNIHFSMNISGQKSLYAGSGLQNNTWYMLAFVHDFDGTNTTAKIFINSALGAEATYTGSQATNTGRTFQMSGWRSDNPTDGAFNGKISAVQIYSRALSEQEIRQNFNAHRNRYGV